MISYVIWWVVITACDLDEEKQLKDHVTDLCRIMSPTLCHIKRYALNDAIIGRLAKAVWRRRPLKHDSISGCLLGVGRGHTSGGAMEIRYGSLRGRAPQAPPVQRDVGKIPSTMQTVVATSGCAPFFLGF